MRVRSEDDLFTEDFTPVSETVAEPPAQPRSRGRGDGSRSRPRGRGRGRGDQSVPRGGNGNGAGAVQARSVQQDPQPQSQPQTQTQPNSTPPESAPKGPRKDSIPSVRGDRQSTGGVSKPKLTEAELAEKMAQIQLKNATLTAAHARAEADAASFAQREEEAKRVATRRQKEERKDRQQMMGEREKNRMRKLKAMEGREWDAEKNEEDFQRGGKFDKRGNFAGDKEEYTDGREYIYMEPRGGGGRGERGVGRGERGQKQTLPRQEEFPALPPAPQQGSQRGQDAVNRDAVKSWADQVELSNA